MVPSSAECQFSLTFSFVKKNLMRKKQNHRLKVIQPGYMLPKQLEI